jgi:hypothetical protein
MKRLLLIILWSLVTIADQKNLMIFLDKECEEKIGTEFNVSYQLVVALMQHAGEILVAQSLLQNIINRKDLFESNLTKSDSIESDFFKIFNMTQSVAIRESIDRINQIMNQAWFSKHFQQINQLSEEKYKHVAFNFLCFYLFKTIEHWNFIKQENGFVLCSLQKNKQTLSQKDILALKSDSQGSIIPALQSLIKNKKDTWVVYLSGHGHPKNGREQALISGMSAQEFRVFLEFLEGFMNTTLLVYNSCFAGGPDGLSVYKDLLLSYSVIMTSIASAPTYVFGTPSGFKLPPYSANNQLENSDIQDGNLKPFFLQSFTEFFKSAHQQFCDDTCMLLINPYKGCVKQSCSVYQFENIPMIRSPQSNRFMPLNEKDHFVFDNIKENKIMLEDQTAVLWYQKQYFGSIYCVGTTPRFISMLHAKKNQHYIHELVISTKIENFLSQAFMPLEDAETGAIWNIDRVIVQTRRGQKIYHQVQVVQNKKNATWTF